MRSLQEYFSRVESRKDMVYFFMWFYIEIIVKVLLLVLKYGKKKTTFCTFCCDIGAVRFTVKCGMCMSIKIQNWQPGLCHQTEVTVFRRVAVDPLDTYIKISWHHYSHLIKNDMPVLHRCTLTCYGYTSGVDAGILPRGSPFCNH